MSKKLVGTLTRVLNRAVCIDGDKWFSISVKTKLPVVPLERYVGQLVEVEYNGKWLDSIKPVNQLKDTSVILEKIEQLDKKLDHIQKQLEEINDFIRNYIERG